MPLRVKRAARAHSVRFPVIVAAPSVAQEPSICAQSFTFRRDHTGQPWRSRAYCFKLARNKPGLLACKSSHLLSEVAHVSPVGLANYLEKDASTGIIKLKPNTSLFSPGYLMALAAATQLNVLDFVTAILGDPSPTQELRKQNGAILSEINAKGTI